MVGIFSVIIVFVAVSSSLPRSSLSDEHCWSGVVLCLHAAAAQWAFSTNRGPRS